MDSSLLGIETELGWGIRPSWWLSGKESACNAGDAKDVGSVPRLGRSPRGGNRNPFRTLAWKIPWQRSLADYSPSGYKELDTT